MQPHLKPSEQKLFKNHLKKSRCYFEYGIGGSTVQAYKLSNIPIYGIETCLKWIEKVEKNIKDKKRYKCQFIDIGPTGSWGKPLTEEKKNNWTDYPTAIFNMDFKIPPDLILIDGRFRVACVLSAIKYIQQNNINATLLLHDCLRKEYRPINKYIKRVNQHQELLAFKPKKNINIEELDKDFEKYKYQIR